jgi:hypothetical protein
MFKQKLQLLVGAAALVLNLDAQVDETTTT